ncbi:MAG: hypothetical protein KGJ39_08735, partial [Acidobacteriota bacterium]|nr:hypothetical protein [Acidobacteriota bacterium]
GVNVGSGWSAMTGNVNSLTFGTSAETTTYNFELGLSGNRPFVSAGSGAETPGTPNCQFGTSCTVTITTGSAIGEHLGRGTYSSSLTIYWSLAISNGANGYCAPASGTGTLVAANGDTLNQSEVGTVCEVGTSSLTAPHTFAGTYVNIGGTGRFANAIGEGMITGGDDGSGNAYYNESGSIGY